MKASELIKELKERIFLYGDYEVLIRDDDDQEIDAGSVYFDEDAERIIISSFHFFLTDEEGERE